MNIPYEFGWDNKYCYPNSSVLKNKLNITDDRLFSEAERKITSVRIYDLRKNPVQGAFDLLHLRKIHYSIFSDIYTWAGQLRNVDIAKGNMFCKSVFIPEQAAEIFCRLRQEHYLIGCSSDSIPERLAFYLSEINAIHPFREGNGRSQRAFIESLAKVAGYKIDFSHVSAEEMIGASAEAFQCKYSKMNAIFQRITTAIPLDEQEEYIAKVAPPDSHLLELYQERLSEELSLQEEQGMELE